MLVNLLEAPLDFFFTIMFIAKCNLSACACMCVCMCLCVHACVYGNHWDIELIHNSFLGNHNTLFEMCFDDVFLKFSFYVCKTYAKLFYKLNSNFYIPVLF